MRITGGQFKGRVLKTPRGDNVRPTQDCVRESLFSIIQGELPGARFLDLYAGTGAVGIEALSRGAKDVQWVEGNKGTSHLTRDNVTSIAGEAFGYSVICSDAMRYIRSMGKGAAFDIIFADPPYIDAREDGLTDLMKAIASNGVIASDGLLIVEMPKAAPIAEIEGWTLLRDRTYGKTRIVIRQWMPESK